MRSKNMYIAIKKKNTFASLQIYSIFVLFVTLEYDKLTTEKLLYSKENKLSKPTWPFEEISKI